MGEPDTTPQDAQDRVPLGSALPAELRRFVQSGVVRPPAGPGYLGVLGRYRLLKWIGEGSMGVVYAAQAPESAALVAVKLLRHELLDSPQAMHAFTREARHMESLKHDHIQSVTEVAYEGGAPYFVSPFHRLGSLADEQTPPLSEAEVLSIAKGIASALKFAHSRGIIHRDVKPANALLRGRCDPCLADFGLGRRLHNDSLHDPARPHRIGTPAYMSPGVASGDEEDTRADIYGFGATLYELLCGRPPYCGPDAASVMQQVMAGPPPKIADVNPRAPRRLAFVAETAMARELRERYASMSDVLADLQRVESGQQPVGAHRPAAPMGRWTAAAAPVAVLGMLALVAGTYFAFREDPRENRADRAAVAERPQVPAPDAGQPHQKGGSVPSNGSSVEEPGPGSEVPAVGSDVQPPQPPALEEHEEQEGSKSSPGTEQGPEGTDQGPEGNVYLVSNDGRSTLMVEAPDYFRVVDTSQHVAIVPFQTRVEVLDTKPDRILGLEIPTWSRIRVLEGEHQGLVGWVSSRTLMPAVGEHTTSRRQQPVREVPGRQIEADPSSQQRNLVPEMVELRRRALSPEVLNLLRPLTTPDYTQPRQILGLMATGETTAEKQPVSLTRLRTLGVLDTSESGMKKVAILNSSNWTSRPRWSMQYEASEPGLWSAEQRRMIISTQAYLKEYGDILVEEGLLAP